MLSIYILAKHVTQDCALAHHTLTQPITSFRDDITLCYDDVTPCSQTSQLQASEMMLCHDMMMSSQNAMQQTPPIQGPAKPQPSGQAGELGTNREAENKKRDERKARGHTLQGLG